MFNCIWVSVIFPRSGTCSVAHLATLNLGFEFAKTDLKENYLSFVGINLMNSISLTD